MNRVRSKPGKRTRRISAVFAAAIIAAAAPGCTPFDINVGADEPLAVDINMDVHVYQHGQKDEEEEAIRKSYEEVTKNRRNRGKEIQDMKNNRLIGESHTGLLVIRSQPAGKVGEWVKDTVKSENEDREFLIRHEAKQKGVEVDEIRRIQWRQWQRKSFKGEWIEIEGEKPGTFIWVQKKGAGDDN